MARRTSDGSSCSCRNSGFARACRISSGQRIPSRPSKHAQDCHGGELVPYLGMLTQVSDESSLRALAEKLDQLEPRIPYHLWVEQP